MWLTNLRAPGGDSPRSTHLAPNPASVGSAEPTLSLDGDLVFPGLINSHDHLDFNLFPSLANRRYTNYRAWGWDIHTQNADQINAVLKIPLALRIQWGIYKNLFSGFTTVVNHGECLDTEGSPITVFQDCHNLHSIGFERYWRWKLNRRPKPQTSSTHRHASATQPVVLHVGEGTDILAHQEITSLLRWNLFKRPLIGIHGVAMTEKQAAGFQALVWCPASNYFLLDQTAPIAQLKTRVPILFGTDSTLTAPWDGWSQIRLARKEGAATDNELFQMLTINPATAWGLDPHDTIIARPNTGTAGWDAFYSLTPDNILLIIREGKIILFDASLKQPLTDAGCINDHYYQAGPNGKYVPDDINSLMEQIRSYYPEVEFPTLPLSYTSG